MTNNNLTLDNALKNKKGWKKVYFKINKNNDIDLVGDGMPELSDYLVNITKEPKQQLIEQFKNMFEKLKKQHIYVEPIDHPDKNEELVADGYNMACDEINQKIDEILKELKVIEEEK